VAQTPAPLKFRRQTIVKPEDKLCLNQKIILKCDNEGKLNNKELNNIISIAERDGVIDQNEIRVLQKIISKIKTDEIDDTSRRRLKLLAKKISV